MPSQVSGGSNCAVGNGTPCPRIGLLKLEGVNTRPLLNTKAESAYLRVDAVSGANLCGPQPHLAYVHLPHLPLSELELILGCW